MRRVWNRRSPLLLVGLGLGCIGIGLAVATATRSAPRRTTATLAAAPLGPSGAWRIDAARQAGPDEVEGYAGATSVAPGQALPLYVHSAGAYRVEIYRIGWYGGLGGTLVACLPACDGTEPAQAQPAATVDSSTLEYRAAWRRTDALPIGVDWLSGYYQANLVLESGRQYAIPFVVRGNATPAPLLVVVPVNTWQAYNEWGGKSLYSDPEAATHVSFDRPYRPTTGSCRGGSSTRSRASSRPAASAPTT